MHSIGKLQASGSNEKTDDVDDDDDGGGDDDDDDDDDDDVNRLIEDQIIGTLGWMSLIGIDVGGFKCFSASFAQMPLFWGGGEVGFLE